MAWPDGKGLLAPVLAMVRCPWYRRTSYTLFCQWVDGRKEQLSVSQQLCIVHSSPGTESCKTPQKLVIRGSPIASMISF